VSDLGFLSPDRATGEAVWRSPLERALAHAPEGIEDVSRAGVLDVRGNVGSLALDRVEIARLTPERALVVCDPGETSSLRARLRGNGFWVVDLSAGYAGLRVQDEAVLRRVTDLDLDALPAVGSVAHVQTLVFRDGEEAFRLLFPQEYGHHLAEVVVDAAEGLSAA
jgi:sarcosine oxidase gamma subunit